MNTPERFSPCPECACFVRADDRSCPHCGQSLTSSSAIGVSAAALMLGLATSCIGPKDDVGDAVALYGVADTSVHEDNDGDGWQTPDDCDDDDADINPDADETEGDGVDSNCDGDDDT